MAVLPYVCAFIVCVGGSIGYAKKKSHASFIAGLALGTAYVIGAAKIEQGNAELGNQICMAASAAMGASMGRRAVATKKVMPIVLGVTGVVTALHFFYQSVQ